MSDCSFKRVCCFDSYRGGLGGGLSPARRLRITGQQLHLIHTGKERGSQRVTERLTGRWESIWGIKPPFIRRQCHSYIVGIDDGKDAVVNIWTQNGQSTWDALILCLLQDIFRGIYPFFKTEAKKQNKSIMYLASWECCYAATDSGGNVCVTS